MGEGDSDFEIFEIWRNETTSHSTPGIHRLEGSRGCTDAVQAFIHTQCLVILLPGRASRKIPGTTTVPIL